MLEKDIGKIPDAQQFTTYISELKESLDRLAAEEKELSTSLHSNDFSPSEMETTRYQLQDFIRNVKLLPPDNQWLLLRKYIREINYEPSTNLFNIDLVIPSNEPSNHPLLEKKCYTENKSL